MNLVQILLRDVRSEKYHIKIVTYAMLPISLTLNQRKGDSEIRKTRRIMAVCWCLVLITEFSLFRFSDYFSQIEQISKTLMHRDVEAAPESSLYLKASISKLLHFLRLTYLHKNC